MTDEVSESGGVVVMVAPGDERPRSAAVSLNELGTWHSAPGRRVGELGGTCKRDSAGMFLSATGRLDDSRHPQLGCGRELEQSIAIWQRRGRKRGVSTRTDPSNLSNPSDPSSTTDATWMRAGLGGVFLAQMRDVYGGMRRDETQMQAQPAVQYLYRGYVGEVLRRSE